MHTVLSEIKEEVKNLPRVALHEFAEHYAGEACENVGFLLLRRTLISKKTAELWKIPLFFGMGEFLIGKMKMDF